MPAFIDLTGQNFGRLTVIKRAADYRPGYPRFLCRCSCGAEKVVRANMLRDGTTKSCGCYNVETHREMCIVRNSTHRLTRTPEHVAWVNIRQRCENPKAAAFEKYGARGISVCERWQTFENFLADVGPRPSARHSIDRIDPKGNYEPSNCRWATMREQQNNRTNNHRLTFNGETLTLMQWERRSGINRKTLKQRLGAGWPLDRALTEPAVRGRNQYSR